MRLYWLAAALVASSFVVGLWVHPQLPEDVPSHWDSRGEVDGYLPKFWGAFLMPFVALGLFLLLYFLPRIDPLRKNVKGFEVYYDWFMITLIGFFLYMYALTLAWNWQQFAFAVYVIPAISVLVFMIGVVLKHVKRNWFIGIRTPWTLSSEKVWNQTHVLGSKVFKGLGVFILLGLFLPLRLWHVIVVVVAVAVFVIGYSYWIYRK